MVLRKKEKHHLFVLSSFFRPFLEKNRLRFSLKNISFLSSSRLVFSRRKMKDDDEDEVKKYDKEKLVKLVASYFFLFESVSVIFLLH